MTATVTHLPDIQPHTAPDPLMLPAARALSADGITPAHVLSWDPSGTDRSVLALSVALEEYLTVTGVAAIWVASGPGS